MSGAVRLAPRYPRRGVRVLALSGLAVLVWPGIGAAQPTPPAYSASAAADGVRVTVTLAGAPITDTPVDAGFPTATALSDSLGTGEAYAAMPDPGSFVLTTPGLIAGLLAREEPPVDVPALPPYPLSVRAVRGLTPEQSVGEPPFTLSARAGDAEVESRATSGMSLSGGTGLLSGVSSRTVVSETATGSVIVEASSELSGITAGPLALGQVTSVARMTLEPGGAVTKEHELRIDGARIGGVPIGISTEGLDVAGVPVPVPIGAALEPLLSAADITIELLPAEDFPDRVIAPAVRITMPVSGSAVGVDDGTLVLTFGAATAYLSTAAPILPSTPALPPAAAPPAPTGGSGGATSAPVAGSPSIAAPSVGASPSAPRSTTGAGVPASAVLGLFDIEALYLITAACAAGAWGIGHITRVLGVRRAWTSSAG